MKTSSATPHLVRLKSLGGCAHLARPASADFAHLIVHGLGAQSHDYVKKHQRAIIVEMLAVQCADEALLDARTRA